LNATVLGVLMMIWGAWGVFQNGSSLMRADESTGFQEQLRQEIERGVERSPLWPQLSVQEQDRIRAKVNEMAESVAPAFELEDKDRLKRTLEEGWQTVLETFPQWQQLSSQRQEDLRGALSQGAAGVVVAFRRLKNMEPLKRTIWRVEFGLGLLWLSLGLVLLAGISEARVWAPWLAFMTIGWALIGHFALEGLAMRKASLEVITTLGVVHEPRAAQELEAGIATMLVEIQTVLPALLWSSFVLWFGGRTPAKA